MPPKLHGKKLSAKEHRLWKRTYEGAKRSGANKPGGVATAKVMKRRGTRKP